MALDQSQIELIDQRIRAYRQMTEAAGSCVSRDSTGPGAMVVFDGSTVAMPVKVTGNVMLQEGDRCVMDRYGSDWVVTNSWSAVGLGRTFQTKFGPTSPGVAQGGSASFIDQTDIPVMTFTKVYDLTYVRLALSSGCYATTVGAGIRWGYRVTPVNTGTGYTATDYSMGWIFFNNANEHLSTYFATRATDMPAGDYVIQVRWRRGNGVTGATYDSNDLYTCEIDELVPFSGRFL